MKTKRRLSWLFLLAAALFSPWNSHAQQPAIQITGGGYHTLFVRGDHSLWAMGYNEYGQLGDGGTNNGNYATNRPEPIGTAYVTAIAAGAYHSLFLENDGSLWAMGADHYGQLGDKANNDAGTNLPELIVTNGVTGIAAGQYHTLFIKSDGSLWGMGYDEYGQLGDGGTGVLPYYSTNRPELIVTNGVRSLAAGGLHSLFIKTNGSLWAMGYNYYGQLGNGTNVNTNRPIMIVASNVIAAAAGNNHSLFVKGDGSLWAMGNNQYGQLGDLTFNNTNAPEMILSNGVIAVAAGGNHSLFLKNDGSLWGMGDNDDGELGIGYYSTNAPYGLNSPQKIATGVTGVSAGTYHSLFLKNDGSLWAMGYNAYGELGDGTDGSSPYYAANAPEKITSSIAGYNQISEQPLTGGAVQLSYYGVAGINYALDRATSLLPANWTPQATNLAGAGGQLLFTNVPNATGNNFWRIRSVP